MTTNEIELPASTAWPLVLALGFTLMCAGLLTHIAVSALGIFLVVAGCVGWFREVLPHPHEVALPITGVEAAATTQRRVVERLPVAQDQVRAWLPVQTHPVSAGLKGGIAGGAAMAVTACAYGVIAVGSIWNPINLLAACVYAQSVKLTPSELNSFHADSFWIAVVIHVVVSITVGLLYGAMLPMFDRHPILLGGLIGPVLWSALIYTMLSLLNPLLEHNINWLWFMASQMSFGIVAGLVVERYPRSKTRENVAFPIRAGVAAPGLLPPRPEGD